MARKKKADMSAFDDLLGGMGFSNTMSQEEPVDVSNMLDNDDVQNLDDNDDQTGNQQGAEDDNGEGNQVIDPHDDNSEIPEDILNNKQTSDPNQGLEGN